MSKDQAARIAEKALGVFEPDTTKLATAIRRAIASAVRKERERCVECVAYSKRVTHIVHHAGMCDAIIEAINGGKR